MTCDEFRRLTESRKPHECSRGERLAWMRHRRGCVPCARWFVKVMRPRERAEGYRGPTAADFRSYLRDLSDPGAAEALGLTEGERDE